MSKFQVGQSVVTLVERGVAKEGDCGKIDAVHSQEKTYTVGFYATEDACLGRYRFQEDELRPLEEEDPSSPFHHGDHVVTLVEQCGFPAGTKGEVLEVFPKTQGVAVQIENAPYILPYGFQDVLLESREEEAHSSTSPIKS